MPHHILIVSREDPDLYAFIADRFTDDPTIEVTLDRRFVKRRQRSTLVAAERRRRDRRMRPGVDEELRSRAHVVVTLTLEPEGVGDAIRWLEAGLSHLPTISGILNAYDRLQREAEVGKQEVEQLRAEVVRLRALIDQYRREWEDLGALAARMNAIVSDLYLAAARVATLIHPAG